MLKNDDNVRLILKKLNRHVQYADFKMESILSILSLVTPNCWMASVDLKDAYHSPRVHPAYQKYLKLFQYTTYANGLSSCLRRFTKLLKSPLSKLRLLNKN